MAKILLADDDKICRHYMKHLLNKAGYHVVLATNSDEAINEYITQSPDLILMDLELGDDCGFEIAQKIRDMSGKPHIPIIFISSPVHQSSLIKHLYDFGEDFIIKPAEYDLLVAKITTLLRAYYLNKAQLQQHKNLTALDKKLKWEQDVTERIFQNIIDKNKFQIKGCRYYISSASLSCGDFLLASKTVKKPHVIKFIMGDMTGHGLSAAIGTLPVSQLFNDYISEGRSLQEIAYLLNNHLNLILPDSHFCAAVLFQIDMISGELQVINAGQSELFIAAESKGITTHIPSTMIPLGIIEQELCTFAPQLFLLHKGDHLFAYTDGLVEAQNSLGEMFGSDRLKQIFSDYESEQWVDSIIEQVNKFLSKQSDDITLIDVEFQQELYLNMTPTPTPAGSGATIVLIDDNKSFIKLYTDQLITHDPTINLITATNGYEGLLCIGHHRPEIVITDLMMPEMSGFELIQSIRSNDYQQNCRIVAITGLSNDEITENGGLPDEIIVLKKPFTFEELIFSIGWTSPNAVDP